MSRRTLLTTLCWVTLASLTVSAAALGERVQVTLKDGNVFQGVLAGEAETYIVLQVGPHELTLQRATIAEIRLVPDARAEAPDVEPLRAMWSSLIIPGFGQFLSGELAKGFLHLGPAIGLALNLAISYQGCTDDSPSGQSCTRLDRLVPALVPYMAWAFYSAADAYTTSERLRREP